MDVRGEGRRQAVDDLLRLEAARARRLAQGAVTRRLAPERSPPIGTWLAAAWWLTWLYGLPAG